MFPFSLENCQPVSSDQSLPRLSSKSSLWRGSLKFGISVVATGIGVNIVTGEFVGVTVDGILVGVGEGSVVFVVTIAVDLASGELDLGAGEFVGVTVDGILVGVGKGSVVFAVTIAVDLASGELDLGAGEFVGSGLYGSFVGDGSSRTSATTFASGLGASTI